jgi:ATP adenylyltransferase
MLLVPRSREHFEGISINALGCAGSFFVKNAGELARVREKGPMAVLRAVASMLTFALPGSRESMQLT